jgi:hypothetical protein
MQATGSGAGFGASGLSLANAGVDGMARGFNAAGTMAGQMGQNATNMYGVQSRDYYQQNGESIGGILGGLGGLAAGVAKVALL